MLIDTHCHLHDREFFTAEQAEEMIQRAHTARVEKIICIGTSHEDSLAAREFASKHDNIYWTYGIHPENVNSYRQLEYDFLGTGSARPVVTGEPPLATSVVTSGAPQKVYSQLPVAIGEVGLDYHYPDHNREAQIRLFEQMLQLASDNDLPVSFHVREAFQDFFPVVANFPKVRGVVHSFTDSRKVLKRILNETDFYVGVNGLATYSTLPTPPLERILLETDAPFLTPEPFRGIINEPAHVSDIANWLAAKLGSEFKIIEKETTKNGRKLFRI